jgi:formyl-CoA transferase/CoA:oxalate CoA-transferase
MGEQANDPRYTTNADRLANIEPLYEAIEVAMGTMTTAEIVAKLDAAAVPCGPINTIGEILEDPQVADQELRVKVPHATLGEVEVTGFPYKFDGTPLEMRSGPPVLGEHTREVLIELEFSEDEVAKQGITLRSLE